MKSADYKKNEFGLSKHDSSSRKQNRFSNSIYDKENCSYADNNQRCSSESKINSEINDVVDDKKNEFGLSKHDSSSRKQNRFSNSIYDKENCSYADNNQRCSSESKINSEINDVVDDKKNEFYVIQTSEELKKQNTKLEDPYEITNSTYFQRKMEVIF